MATIHMTASSTAAQKTLTLTCPKLLSYSCPLLHSWRTADIGDTLDRGLCCRPGLFVEPHHARRAASFHLCHALFCSLSMVLISLCAAISRPRLLHQSSHTLAAPSDPAGATLIPATRVLQRVWSGCSQGSTVPRGTNARCICQAQEEQGLRCTRRAPSLCDSNDSDTLVFLMPGTLVTRAGGRSVMYSRPR